MAFEQDKEIALETCKQWLEDNDAAYLAKEDVIIFWTHFNPESKRGEWSRYKMKEACRVIKATRAGFAAMRFIKPELLMMAAQETERAYKQAVKSRSTVPDEFFNLERSGHFNNIEMLTMCMLQELVGRGWNVEAVCLGELMKAVFQAKGFSVPNRTLRWKLLRAVEQEAGVVIRDRTNRLTVTGVGRFVAIQIDGVDDSIKTEFTVAETEDLVTKSIQRFNNY
ncbi:hypothetical protein HOT32_gp27 [Erwinia phage Faunus]|uniref:Uncharacterized protein n=1 Tax=Erwinia phage Faunus TaxID=2182346 RepID=A0A2U8UWN1_9CAUD|nr:hypothetical protein HOT32_gp27 [Erwinia phage Faunus]AWN08610.1 hypothetical protein [Erwinia phage Faunus]